MSKLSLRTHSFIWGGLAALAVLGLGIWVSSGDMGMITAAAVVAVLAFTLVSCLILDNNFVGEMVSGVFSWGFVQMPGLITTLDLDGLIWLLTVKLLFWVLGIILAIICGTLAIALGLVVSLFVYPYAIIRNIRHGEG